MGQASDTVVFVGDRRLFVALACGLTVAALADILVGSSSLGARLGLLVELAALVASVYYIVRPPLKVRLTPTGATVPGWPPVKWAEISHISVAPGPYWLPPIRVRVLALVPVDLEKVLAGVSRPRREWVRYRTTHYGTPFVLFGPDVEGGLDRLLTTVHTLNPNVRTEVSA
jgi:hypothetical protein